MDKTYDALFLVSFGGPESLDEVKPFLERITEGKNIPANRLEEVTQRYETVGGVSPLNANMRNIKEKLETEIKILNMTWFLFAIPLLCIWIIL